MAETKVILMERLKMAETKEILGGRLKMVETKIILRGRLQMACLEEKNTHFHYYSQLHFRFYFGLLQLLSSLIFYAFFTRMDNTFIYTKKLLELYLNSGGRL